MSVAGTQRRFCVISVCIGDAVYWTDFDYSLLNSAKWLSRKKRGKYLKYYEKVITADTETCKYTDEIIYVTDWSVTIQDIGVIYGNNIQDMIKFLSNVIDAVCNTDDKRIVVYMHNYPYDYVFMRNHMFQLWGEPIECLAIKPHRYIYMQFKGIEFRDSYILSQRSLENFCRDMGCTSKKKVGAWDYNKFRTPKSGRTSEEMEYLLLDTIAQNEAIVRLMKMHNTDVAFCQLTNTGFVRKAGRDAQRKKDKEWRKKFINMSLTLEQYRVLEEVYHGGYTHSNRFSIGKIYNDVVSYDFASSYPATQCYEKFPMEDFKEIEIELHEIMELQDEFAFFGYIYFTDLECDNKHPMPPISYHKTKTCIDFLTDNGKVIRASELVLPFSDPDLECIIDCYKWSSCRILKCWYTKKDYLPEWFTSDFVMPYYYNKCTMKEKDYYLYMISKGMLNGIYGMSVQKIIREEILEDFESGDWKTEKTIKDDEKAQESLDRHYNSYSKYLPYQWGVYVTAYAMRNLYRLGKCCKLWLYSDTDSVKGIGWDIEMIEKYNKEIEEKAIKRNLGIVEYNGKNYMLGKAEFDGKYDEFVSLGSKRYCYRENGELHITVAGVPKNGVKQLNNDIYNFRPGMIFKGGGENGTGKNQVTYIMVKGIRTIEIDGEEIEYGSSIRLDPCDYDLDMTFLFDKETNLPYNVIYT